MTVAGLEVRVEAISKRYGETRALSEVSLSVLPGTVHALIGENGAGKSTLGRVLAGVIRPDSGQIHLADQPVEFHSPRDALSHGIAAIAQEIALVPALNGPENVLLGVEPRSFGVVRRGEMAVRFQELAEGVGFDIDPTRAVGSLPVAQQQQVEILRALSRDARLIVMDEPSARLSAVETSKLHAIIRRLVADGRSVLLISHFLNEVLDVADEVTILRDGQTVRHARCADETEGSLIEGMLGREVGAQFPPRVPPASDAPTVLAATGLSGPGFSEATLHIRAGEIVGLSGLVGAGRSELGQALIGATRLLSGTISLDGRPTRFRSPRDALKAGAFMLPESRRDQGLFFLRPTRENVSVSMLAEYSRAGFVDLGPERRATAEMLERVQVSSSPEMPVAALSGGNQQKVLFARALSTQPRLLVADEPTRGVDVGAKRQIYELLAGLAAAGMAILLISSEMEEILGMSHRVLVMRAGRLVAELEGDEISEAAILAAIFEAQVGPGEAA